jgi:hypothetical protein
MHLAHHLSTHALEEVLADKSFSMHVRQAAHFSQRATARARLGNCEKNKRMSGYTDDERARNQQSLKVARPWHGSTTLAIFFPVQGREVARPWHGSMALAVFFPG